MSRPPKVARVASAALSKLLDGPQSRRGLIVATQTSNGTVGRAVRMLRKCGIVIDNEGSGGSVYRLRHPGKVRGLMASALELSIGDIIEAGGIAPAVGLGLLIEAGALHTEAG